MCPRPPIMTAPAFVAIPSPVFAPTPAAPILAAKAPIRRSSFRNKRLQAEFSRPLMKFCFGKDVFHVFDKTEAPSHRHVESLQSCPAVDLRCATKQSSGAPLMPCRKVARGSAHDENPFFHQKRDTNDDEDNTSRDSKPMAILCIKGDPSSVAWVLD
jgi:hypothetical protein